MVGGLGESIKKMKIRDENLFPVNVGLGSKKL